MSRDPKQPPTIDPSRAGSLDDERTVVDFSDPDPSGHDALSSAHEEVAVSRDIDVTKPSAPLEAMQEIDISEATLIRKSPSIDEKTVVQRSTQAARPQAQDTALDDYFDARTVVGGFNAPVPGASPSSKDETVIVRKPEVPKAQVTQASPGSQAGTSPASMNLKKPSQAPSAHAAASVPSSHAPPSPPAHTVRTSEGVDPESIDPLSAPSIRLLKEGEEKPSIGARIAILRARVMDSWASVPIEKRKTVFAVGGVIAVAALVISLLSGGSEDGINAEAAAELASQAPATAKPNVEPGAGAPLPGVDGQAAVPGGVGAASRAGPDQVMSMFDQAFARTQEQTYPKSR